MEDTLEAMQVLALLRKDLFQAIKFELEKDDYCKSNEGAVTVEAIFPNFFEDGQAAKGPRYFVTLRCYALGPHRHYR